jgi:clan AA aspartic protease (TIGR02281 family)
MSCRQRHARGIVAMGLLGLLLLTYEEGQAIYRCYDKEGRHVLTDQPAQLERCVLLDVVVPPKSDSKKLPAAPIPAVPGSTEQRRGLSHEQGAGLVNHTVEVPLQQVGHLFVATVKLNGEQDARLIVDTGASHSIVSHRLAVELGLYSDSSMGTATMNTVGGPVQAPLAQIKSIRLGEAEVKESVVVIYDLPDSPAGVEGLLGLSALRQFQVTLDPTRKVLSLQPTAK